MDDRIEHRIAVRAPLDRVWSLVTRPGWWLPGSAAEPARAGGRAAVGWGREERPWVIDVIRVEPQGYASFRWAAAFGGVAPEPGNSTLVEFYVRPVGDVPGERGVAEHGVAVTVVESGFSSLDLTGELRRDQVTASAGGWQYELAGLRMRAEQLESSR
ncbi:MAG TPA: polyketide cyclase [Trebonia sp.]|jgi:hypothetical protein|nr:polyketide cyclase [Trebonia sp.]